MKALQTLLRYGALAVTLALPACQAFAIRPAMKRAAAPFVKRDIYDVPEVAISGLTWNTTSSAPTFDFAAGTASIAGDLNVYVDFSSTDDSVTYESLNVKGYYVYTGSDAPVDLDNKTQIACGTLSGPLNINVSQPLQVPITVQISNASLVHPIIIDVASLCLGGAPGAEITTVWGGWVQASVSNETYRCPLPITNLTIPCPGTLQAPPADSESCKFIAEPPLPPATSTSSSSEPSSTTAPTEPATTESTSPAAPTEPATTESSSPVESTTETATTTTSVTETVSIITPELTIATPTPTEAPVAVIVTVTETATAPARRRRA